MECDYIQIEGMSLLDAFFVDSGLTYTGVPADTISGLDHLEGETVQVLADGASHPDCLVTGGTIELNREAAVVQAGLGYATALRTMRVEAGAQMGTAQGKIKRIHRVVLRLLSPSAACADRTSRTSICSCSARAPTRWTTRRPR